MSPLELSVFNHSEATTNSIRKILAQLEKEERIRVNLTVIPWQGGWARMVNVALYGEGFDISEIGSTWVGDFVKMDALSPFSPADLRVIGMEKDFLPASWSSGTTKTGEGQAIHWAIPWSADTRVIYYRRDWLARAGIDETTAFVTPAAFDQTLTRLKASGVEIPLTLPVERSRQNVHNLASYVWGAGGGFLSPDGRKVLFDSPEALTGMKNFFQLGRHLAPQVQNLGEGASEQHFTSGLSAVTISGTWVPTQNFAPGVWEHVGTAPVPGVSWVGGSNFVIWKNCLLKREAARAIQYLTSGTLSHLVYPSVGLPTRLVNLNTPTYMTDPHWRVMREALLNGRAFPTEQLWGLIESRLTDLLPFIWRKVLTEPQTPIEKILDQFIVPLVTRLGLTLSARH
ncbi:MAG: sugar ABC transporter substrate-binding protein [Anaerolineales bacterium]